MSAILNADDLGMNREANEGILRAARRGWLDSVSLGVTEPEAFGEVRDRLEELGAIPIGLHLSLSEGEPAGARGDPSGLLGANGRFRPATEILADEDKLAVTEIRDEILAQVRRFESWLGRPPAHLDCHQHLAYLSPRIFSVFLEVAQARAIAIRSPRPFLDRLRLAGFSASVVSRFGVTLPFDPASRADALAECFARQSPTLRAADTQVDFHFEGSEPLGAQIAGIRASGRSDFEIVCHPREAERDGNLRF